MNDLENRVVKIIAEKLKVEEARVIPEASFVDDLRADSLDTVDVILALEDEFKIDISDDDSHKFLKVKDAIDYITNKVNSH